MKNKIQLTARTHKGKNKLNEAGTKVWFIIRTKEQQLGACPGDIFIIPETMNENQSRWILWANDPNFEWMPV